ncbi:unnamed protein product [Darwinula stevensoni]|uniref:Ubiquitin-associated protein 1 n=1 Tax=Darwinula stevensoni TaxID=69355 RepID=A0A7R9A0R8_9CRUS|nr:unnamed protein product [Darwinula stevensoni]CAG0886151.1 unnamed protein product [Darwinula stevensoni]
MAQYVEGIPVKISKKFRPPPRISIPNFSYQLSPAPFEEYDFSAEERVLADAARRRLEKEAKEEREKAQEERKEEEEGGRKYDGHDRPSEDNRSTSILPVPDEEKGPCNEPIAMLVPYRAEVSKTLKENNECKDYSSAKGGISTVNPLDFEDDGASPFDQLELKSMNDLQELASVLQSVQCRHPVPSVAPVPNGFVPFPTTSFPNLSRSLPKSKEPSFPPQYIAGFESKNAYSDIGDAMIPCDRVMPSVRSKSVPDLQQAIDLPSQSLSAYSPVTVFPAQLSVGSGVGKGGAPWITGCYGPDPVYSSSSSDLHIQFSLDSNLISTSPSIHELNIMVVYILILFQEWPSLPSDRKRKPTEEDVYLNALSRQEKEKARHIAEMGFSLPRVAHLFGLLHHDEKKVVEHLLEAECLKEQGYPESVIDKMLLCCHGNSKDACEKLQLFTRFRDLGFEEARILEALQRTHCNYEQTLDELLVS